MSDWKETEIGLIPKDWNYIPFKRVLAEPTRNGIYKSKEHHGAGVRVVNMKEIFAFDKLPSIEMSRIELTENELKKALVCENDLLFARRSLVAEGAGKCTLVLNQKEPLTFESSIIRARPNQEQAKSEYLFYLFLSKFGKYLLKTILRQVAVSGITGIDLVNLKLPLPPLQEQKEIAAVLSCLDTKIENLRRQNETLEQIAQTLFKHWFIDFEFPNEKGEPYRSSGGAMQPSELGEIPVGWRVGKLGDYCTVFRGSSPRPISSPIFFENGTLPWIKIADATRSRSLYISKTKEFCTELALPFTRFLKKGSLILSNSATVGIPMILNLDGCIHDGWLSFLDYQEITRNFLYFVLVNKLRFLNRYADGTVQKNLNTGILKEMNFILPNSIWVEEFTSFSQAIFDKILTNEQQIQTLTKTRDTLLPQLMSGKLRVTE